MKVKIKNLQKQKKIDRVSLRKKIRLVMDALGCSDRDLEIVLCDNRLIRQLNREFLAHDRPTDVISFPMDDQKQGGVWGEVVVSVEEAVLYGSRHACEWQQELMLYIIHGILHLQGYDDHTAGQKKKMRLKEKQLLQLCCKSSV